MLTAESRRVRAAAPPAPLRDHLPLGDPAGVPDRIEVTSRWIERDGRPVVPRHRRDPLLAGPARALVGGPRPRARRRSRLRRDLRALAGPRARARDVPVGRRPRPARVRRSWPRGTASTSSSGWGPGRTARRGTAASRDWLVDRGSATRTNDPAYLDARARRFYAQTIAQLAGLTHADGGPVVGVQIDNELYDQPAAPGDPADASPRTSGCASRSGPRPAGAARRCPDTLLPVYSAYADGFWEEATTGWPAFAAVPLPLQRGARRPDRRRGPARGARRDRRADASQPSRSRTTTRCRSPPASSAAACTSRTTGGRSSAPRDVAALALAKIGSGSVWQGYYMYAGGHPARRARRHASRSPRRPGYPNDVPTRTYDFHAPVGEHGQVRRHHHLLRRQHLWLADRRCRRRRDAGDGRRRQRGPRRAALGGPVGRSPRLPVRHHVPAGGAARSSRSRASRSRSSSTTTSVTVPVAPGRPARRRLAGVAAAVPAHRRRSSCAARPRSSLTRIADDPARSSSSPRPTASPSSSSSTATSPSGGAGAGAPATAAARSSRSTRRRVRRRVVELPGRPGPRPRRGHREPALPAATLGGSGAARAVRRARSTRSTAAWSCTRTPRSRLDAPSPRVRPSALDAATSRHRPSGAPGR